MAYPLIGSHPINSITPTETLAVLRKVEAKGRYESARRMRSVLSRVFRYGIATARCDRDVAADLRGALTTPKATHHAAITDPDEVGILLKTMDGYSLRDGQLSGRCGSTDARGVAGDRSGQLTRLLPPSAYPRNSYPAHRNTPATILATAPLELAAIGTVVMCKRNRAPMPERRRRAADFQGSKRRAGLPPPAYD